MTQQFCNGQDRSRKPRRSWRDVPGKLADIVAEQRLMLQNQATMGGVAEVERAMMLERQREGIAKAKAEGVYRGRKPTARAKVDEVRVLNQPGKSMREIADALGI